MPKPQNNPMSNPISAAADSYGATSRPPAGNAQEAVSPYPRPDEAADARGNTPRKKTRSAVPGVEADARGNPPRKKTRSAVSGVEADARGQAPRKKTRPVVPGIARGDTPRKKTRSAVPGVEADARGNPPRMNTRPIGQGSRSKPGRPRRRRAWAVSGPTGASIPHLALDNRGLEGEIALLRSLTNRLLSKRPLNHAQISRNLWLLVRAVSANYPLPRENTDEEQIEKLMKNVFRKSVDQRLFKTNDLLSVRMAKPDEKWWPWRNLISLSERERDGLFDSQDPWPITKAPKPPAPPPSRSLSYDQEHWPPSEDNPSPAQPPLSTFPVNEEVPQADFASTFARSVLDCLPRDPAPVDSLPYYGYEWPSAEDSHFPDAQPLDEIADSVEGPTPTDQPLPLDPIEDPPHDEEPSPPEPDPPEDEDPTDPDENWPTIQRPPSSDPHPVESPRTARARPRPP